MTPDMHDGRPKLWNVLPVLNAAGNARNALVTGVWLAIALALIVLGNALARGIGIALVVVWLGVAALAIRRHRA